MSQTDFYVDPPQWRGSAWQAARLLGVILFALLALVLLAIIQSSKLPTTLPDAAFVTQIQPPGYMVRDFRALSETEARALTECQFAPVTERCIIEYLINAYPTGQLHNWFNQQLAEWRLAEKTILGPRP